MKLKRHPHPVMLPDPTSDWETYNVFNPSVIQHYRAQGLDWISRIGYAVSEDGIRWNRMRRPVMEPIDGTDSRGLEDPRVTEIDGVFYMCYTAYGREFLGEGEPIDAHFGGGILPMIARSENLITWERIGPIVKGENNKDHVLFPKKLNNRYAALHRRWPNVWIAFSEDLVRWPEKDMDMVYGPRNDDLEAWDFKSVGSNGVPIETEAGWLLINHGYNDDHIYHMGVCLVDLDDPTKIIARPKTSIFGPEELWEIRGDIPNVVFSSANPVVDGNVYVYYGGGDHVIGLATCRLDELLDFALKG